MNLQELEAELLEQNMHFAELSSGKTNQTELIALLLIQGRNFVEGIENVYKHIKGSCSMLLLTEDGIIAARDHWGRTPVVIGKKDGAYAATSESSSFPNLGYEIDRYLGPGEIVRLHADRVEQMRKPNEGMQICSFLWVYYGFPTSCYEGKNVEEVRFSSGLKWDRPIPRRWIVLVEFLTPVWVWRWDMPKEKAFPIIGPFRNTRLHGLAALLPAGRSCAHWWRR